MKWRKLGRIYSPDGAKPWARSHAANPVAEHLQDDVFRIYCNTRDDSNRSNIAYVDIDIRNPCRILREAEAPVLTPGAPNAFDSHGVAIGCIVPISDRRLLYYMGWRLTETTPWRNTVGLAISEGLGLPFVKYSEAPIMGVDEIDPITISYPWVAAENGQFRMWYGSTVAWGSEQEDMRHLIKHATSEDGVRWRRNSDVALPLAPTEHILCRPCVRNDGDRYRMWVSARGAAYRIRYAESPDGVAWHRREGQENIDVSEDGWDSEMIEYPFVFDHKNERYMLYCGNGYGQTGFGLAVLESE